MKKFKLLILFCVITIFPFVSLAQNSVGIGTTTPDNSSILELKSNNQGFLVPRLDSTQITLILSPATGLLLYNTTDNCFWYKEPVGWERICNTDAIYQTFIDSLAAINQDITNLYDSIAHHTSQISNLYSSIQTINNNITTINDSLNNYYQYISNINDSIISINTDLTNIYDTLHLHSTQINNLFDSVSVINNQITIINDSLNNYYQYFQNINDSITAINIDLNNIYDTLHIHSTHINNLFDSVQVITQDISALYDSIANHTQQINTINNNINAINQQLIQINTHLNSIDSALIQKWDLNGNTGTNAALNFVGTLDAVDLVFRTNNNEVVRITKDKQVGIGTSIVDQSAILQLETKNKGLLVPRLTSVEITLVSSPADGLLVYNTDVNCFFYYKLNAWKNLCDTRFDSLFVNTLNVDSIIGHFANFDTLLANYIYSDSIFTHYLHADTAQINTGYINNIYNNLLHSDTILAHYIQTDTIISNYANIQNLSIGGVSINNYVGSVVDSMAWLLKGNTGTDPLNNFIGTKDSTDIVVRTNNNEKIRIKANGAVGIGTNLPDSTALVDLNSTKKGLLVPRLTDAQITAVVSPANGLLVYNTTMNCFFFFKSNVWKNLCDVNFDSLFVNSLTVDSIIGHFGSFDTLLANYIYSDSIFTHYLHADTAQINTGTINNIYNNLLQSDSIIAHYVQSDTVISNYANITNLSVSGLTINGTSIQNYTDSIVDSRAWSLLGNTGTDSGANFIGTVDFMDLSFRTNNVENMRIIPGGFVGINTFSPTQFLDVNGKIRLRTGATNNYILVSDFLGVGTWINPNSLAITNKWDILGNSGTNAANNFVGTTDNVDLVFKTNNNERMRIKSNGYLGINTNNPSCFFEVTDGAVMFDGVSGNTPVSGAGTRFMWIPSKIAMRAGRITGTQWDAANIGWGSIALGYNVIAKGQSSISIGSDNTANSVNDICIGYFNQSNGGIALGQTLNALGNGSVAIGIGDSATNTFSVAIGNQCRSYGASSFALGNSSKATGDYSVSLGFNVIASGHYSYAFGTRCSTGGFDGSFVFGDKSSFGLVITSTASNQMKMRFQGGYELYTDNGLTVGVSLAAGGSGWIAVSDFNKKEKIEEINCEKILKNISELSITKWSYITQNPDNNEVYKIQPRHIGPMAQDFYKSFGLGETEFGINSIDIDGINLAAIKGLEKRTADQAKENEKMKIEIEELKKQIEEMRKLIEK